MGAHSYYALQRAGLTNTHTDYLDVLVAKKKVVPFCSSYKCAGDKTKVRKDFGQGKPSMCPDCRSAVLWQVERL